MAHRQPIISLREAVHQLQVTWDGLPAAPDKSNLVDVDDISVNIYCPKCSGGTGRKTLNLNYEKNVFNCPRCSFGGSTYDFISFYTGWNVNEVEKRILRGEMGQTSVQTGVLPDYLDSVGQENVRMLAPLKTRHEVYSEFLNLLSLSDYHRESLRTRGLTDAEINRLGYKSTPVFTEASSIPKRLAAMGLDLRGVPGFGFNDSGDWVVSKGCPSGFLIPGRNGSGLIQGFQIRSDHPSKTTPKYGYFSSSKMPGGQECSVWCHWAGNDLKQQNGQPFDVIITEGWLKGDIAHFKTGANFLCVPGVKSVTKVLPALEAMKEFGLARVMIGYDMDAYSNHDVAVQLLYLFHLLKDEGYNPGVLVWDDEYKGIDDWATACL